MKIRIKQKRESGTKVIIAGAEYFFTPNALGYHVCEVPNIDHANKLLGISEGFQPYDCDNDPPDLLSIWPGTFTNGGITQCTAFLPRIHPVSGKRLDSLDYVVGDRRKDLLARTTKLTYTINEILAVAADVNNWRFCPKLFNYPDRDRTQAAFNIYYRYEPHNSGYARDLVCQINDSHAGATNTYSEVRSMTGNYV